jgi:type 2 lantibiotic biosynthesis protein LanM
VDPFYRRLAVRAATVEELLSSEFETLRGQKGDSDLAAKRLAAWCRSCADGDWSLFARRLQRDNLSVERVLARFATARRRHLDPPPAWISDAMWIDSALQQRATRGMRSSITAAEQPFEDLFTPLADEADARLWTSVDASASDNFGPAARASLRELLVDRLCRLCAPLLYDLFAEAREAAAKPADAVPKQGVTRDHYDPFVLEMKIGGWRCLFDQKPVLLRLIATVTRQWLNTSRELVTRMAADGEAVRGDLLRSPAASPVARIGGALSDPHSGGHCVHLVEFEDGLRVMYKPKDLRLDAAWHALVDRLNLAGAPVELKAVRVLAKDGYGWAEYVEHAGCADTGGIRQFFRRAGAWLALLHCFAAADMHHENIIAAGDHPVPVDLETILQAAVEEHNAANASALKAAKAVIADSVMAVGLLPSYARAVGDRARAVGGMAFDPTPTTGLAWSDINSDSMRPVTATKARATPNLPHIEGRYARLGDHIDDVISGFEDYALFLGSHTGGAGELGLFDRFGGLPVRKVIRPTEFYHMLVHRLQNHRTMDDGVAWSVQADFVARLADWDADADPFWPLQRSERSAALELNVPYFVMPSDGIQISAPDGTSVAVQAMPGLERARARVAAFSKEEISRQIEVIRLNLSGVAGSADVTSADGGPKPLAYPEAAATPGPALFLAEADRIADELSRQAIRGGGAAAWIGLGRVRDSELSQLTVLGPDLYNGACGIAIFLAAHAGATERGSSAELALAAVSQLRHDLSSRSAPRFARSLGIGGATGLGSIVYGLAATSKLLGDAELLADAHRAAELFSDELVSADSRLDVVGGSAGAILALLRLYRDTGADNVLQLAVKCGEHLLAQPRSPRSGPVGRRSWRGFGPDSVALTGMSHGAAGFAYALASLGAATGREDFAAAAAECVAFENYNYDTERGNWPDLRTAEPHWRSQWCHGAVGIGLARLAIHKLGQPGAEAMTTDVRNALDGATRAWPGQVDTLCCGALGTVELFSEAGNAFGRSELCELAFKRLAAVVASAGAAGDYRWNVGTSRFNVGLFRGLAGVGYTCLRASGSRLPNVLIWD